MDYVFFAFSAICVSLILILTLLAVFPGRNKPALVVVLIAVLAGIGYYYLDISLSKQALTAYYLANMLPQIILIILLFTVARSGRKP